MTKTAAGALLKASGRREPVPYRIVGKVRLASGLIRNVPFNQAGELNLR